MFNQTIVIDYNYYVKVQQENEKYRELERKLQSVYGVCDGLLEKVVDKLVAHEGIGFPEPIIKARLLTDGEVDKWEAYKAIGTVEEFRTAMDKEMPKKPEKVKRPVADWFCPSCGERLLARAGHVNYCACCGQHIEFDE